MHCGVLGGVCPHLDALDLFVALLRRSQKDSGRQVFHSVSRLQQPPHHHHRRCGVLPSGQHHGCHLRQDFPRHQAKGCQAAAVNAPSDDKKTKKNEPCLQRIDNAVSNIHENNTQSRDNKDTKQFHGGEAEKRGCGGKEGGDVGGDVRMKKDNKQDVSEVGGDAAKNGEKGKEVFGDGGVAKWFADVSGDNNNEKINDKREQQHNHYCTNNNNNNNNNVINTNTSNNNNASNNNNSNYVINTNTSNNNNASNTNTSNNNKATSNNSVSARVFENVTATTKSQKRGRGRPCVHRTRGNTPPHTSRLLQPFKHSFSLHTRLSHNYTSDDSSDVASKQEDEGLKVNLNCHALHSNLRRKSYPTYSPRKNSPPAPATPINKPSFTGADVTRRQPPLSLDQIVLQARAAIR